MPLEDINFIILEDNKTVITARLLSEISKYFISFIICDEKYEPASIMFAYNNQNNIEFPLPFDTRKELINLLNFEVISNNMHCTVEYSIELLVKSYIKSLEGGINCLVFPNIINDK